jgi:hypothetical protein
MSVLCEVKHHESRNVIRDDRLLNQLDVIELPSRTIQEIPMDNGWV